MRTCADLLQALASSGDANGEALAMSYAVNDNLTNFKLQCLDPAQGKLSRPPEVGRSVIEPLVVQRNALVPSLGHPVIVLEWGLPDSS